jgi:hypothetical protein
MQGNPQPIVPHEAGKATRFRPGPDPRRGIGNGNKRMSTRFICRRLDVISSDGRTANDDILEHLIEVATKWDVVVIGKDSDGEPLKVASARDSVEAAKLLWAYALGKPPASPEDAKLALAEHFRKVETDRFAYALQLLGERAKTMTDEEKANFFNSLVVAQFGSVEMFVKAAESYDHEDRGQITDGQSAENHGEVPSTSAAPDDGSEPTP